MFQTYTNDCHWSSGAHTAHFCLHLCSSPRRFVLEDFLTLKLISEWYRMVTSVVGPVLASRVVGSPQFKAELMTLVPIHMPIWSDMLIGPVIGPVSGFLSNLSDWPIRSDFHNSDEKYESIK